jgi:hypothetical protein
MKKELIYAVITGDIVNSSNLNSIERDKVLNFIKTIFKQIETDEDKILEIKENFVITRGDSFQIVIKTVNRALKYIILLRAGLRGLLSKDVSQLCDARISLGIGTVSYWGRNISESDGDAFRFSGRAFDNKKNKGRLVLKTYDEDFDDEINVYFTLINSIISDWTSSRAQIVYEKILESKQVNIVMKTGISASAISKRLNSAHWNSVELLLNRFEKIINNKYGIN